MKTNNSTMDLSHKVRNMRIIMDSLFTEKEKKCLSSILNDYKANRNIQYLVDNIHPYLDTKAKLIFARCLNEIIPDAHQDLFRDLCGQRGIFIPSPNDGITTRKPSRFNSTYPRIHNVDAYCPPNDYEEAEVSELFEDDRLRQEEHKQDIPVTRSHLRSHIPRPTVTMQISSTSLESRHLFICRLCRLGSQRCESYNRCLPVWGLNLWRSHSTYSVYVMHIDEIALYRHNDIFEHHIKVGQKLKQINGQEVSEIGDDALMDILESSMNIDLLLQGEGVSVGCICEVAGEDYKWIDCLNDRSCSPPAVDILPFDDRRLKPIELIMDESQDLGINIRGGGEFNLGIYISSVKDGSIASIIGLQVGDKLVQINSLGLTGSNTPSHNNSVKMIRQFRNADLWVYSLDKIPLTVIAPNARSKSVGRSGWAYQISEPQGVFLRGPRSQLTHSSLTQPSLETLERQLSDILDKPDVNKVLFLLEKYQDDNISPPQLAIAIHHAINGVWRKKLVLLIMNTLRSSDRFQFHMQLEVIHSTLSEKNLQFNDENVSNKSNGNDTYANIGTDISVNRSKKKNPLRWTNPATKDGTNSTMHNDDQAEKRLDSIDCELENNQIIPQFERYLSDEFEQSVKSDRSDGDKPIPVDNPPDCEETEMDDAKPTSINRITNPVQPFRFIIPKNEILARNRVTKLVTVSKLVPQLGLSIEGGINTPHPLPRIVKIQPKGCVDLCGEIQEGDIILEVDSVPLAGMEHSKIARKIAEAFKATDSDSVEFLIMKPSHNKVGDSTDDSTDILCM